MIREIHVENFKSVEKLTLELGRINVFIGENGCGKSNVLEAIAFAAAAGQNKLDNEFLASRGIRVTEPRFMRSAFQEQATQGVRLALGGEEGKRLFDFTLRSDETQTYSHWVNVAIESSLSQMISSIILNNERTASQIEQLHQIARHSLTAPLNLGGPDFLIYAPENTALRNFQAEGQILPLGGKGEGLFAHLRALGSEKNRPLLDEIIAKLSLIDWFEGFDLPANLSPGERTIHIRDRYLAEGALFDQRSANEGFLFLLFYFTLFISPDTPSFFAVDNVDASLNPKLCARLITELADLAEKHGKQAILTTHNPAVLDGLDLHDDEQRLFVIHRASRGPTKARRVLPPKPIEGRLPMKLSEAFLRGHIGGLPKNF
ncbi:MAG: AAA family ATPase [Byssovorax sp.]